MNEWRPIKTAPKDRAIWVYCPPYHDLNEMIYLCKWHSDAGFCVDEFREPKFWCELGDLRPNVSTLGNTSVHLKGHKSLAEMVSSHISVYRDLLMKARETAGAQVSPDQDDASYYQHELDALTDIEHACTVEICIAYYFV